MAMITLIALAVLFQAPAPAPAASPAALAAQARPEIAAELERGISAYNAQQIAYYEKSLAPDAVYIADDGATFVGRERIVALFTRIFGRTPKARLDIADVVTGGRGDVAWARFSWTLSGIEKARPGVAIVVFARSGEGWQVVSIQNTAKGHGRPASPAPGASPAASHH